MVDRLNLVSGGTGFVGRHLVRALSEAGERVRVLSRSGGLGPELERLAGVEVQRGDVTRRETLKGIAQGVRRVYHLAACGHISDMSEKAYAEFLRVNVEGTRHLLEACGGESVDKFVHFSSTAAMGLIKKPLIDERDPPQPVTPYQKSKLASEELALSLGERLGVATVVVRPCMIYGVGGTGEFHKISEFMRRGLFPQVGRSPKVTPLVHVRDVVKGALLAAERGRSGEVYVLASARSIPLDEMRRLILEAWGTSALYPYVPVRLMLAAAHGLELWSRLTGTCPIVTRQNVASTVQGREFSIEKSRTELGYAPEVAFSDGIAETVAWFRGRQS